MAEVFQLFEHMPAWQKGAWVLACLTASWLLEDRAPLFTAPYDKWRHARANLVLLAGVLAINSAFTAVSVPVFAWTEASGIGLLNWWSFGALVELALGVLFLDLVAQYAVHVLLHRVPALWRFHQVHHSDVHVDATTGTRHHPIDYAFREAAALVTVVAFGIPFAVYMIYRIVTVFFTYATHANLAVPAWLERPLGTVFVTPELHKFHHHHELPWTDTNFGNIFSFWDRAFRTFVRDDVLRIHYGIRGLPDARHADLVYQLELPFRGGRTSRSVRS